ncbi:unnamed protein product [Euphydryas editha]|uniref:Uncharacterized protein n=1 Tax=Euphydryas editha TaxID=104508 RepID=A0AAU9UET2_EUPED|nr:unnamed protein product [Euphydryas editha]
MSMQVIPRGASSTYELMSNFLVQLRRVQQLKIISFHNEWTERKYEWKCSSDENPQHQFCPEGEDSWCKWRKAEAKNELDQFHHDKPPLIPEVQVAIKPVFEDLSKDELLIRCLGAETQNNNEYFSLLIWTFAPKHLHSGPKIVEIASYLSVITFNKDFEDVLKVMSVMGCRIGREAHTYVEKRDEMRISRSERRVSDAVKQARIDSRAKESDLKEFQEEEEGILYGPGITD